MTEELKPHQIAQLVNKLRDIATKYHAHGCLRELISREVNAALTQRPAAQTEREAFEEWVTLNSIIKQYRIKAEDAHWLRASLPTQPAAQATPDQFADASKMVAPVALRSVHLTRDTAGMCVVRINGRVAIRDNGDLIDHTATLEWFADTQQATPEPDDAQRRFEAGCVVLEYLRDIGAPYRAVHHMLIALHGDPEAKSKATPEPVGEVSQFPPMPEGWPARFRCDSCGGNGELGELVSMGHFQPPERQTCPDCGGRGWTSEEHAFNADHLREFAEAHALLTRPAPGVPEEALAVAEHIRAKAATPEPVQPRTFDARNAQFREHNWQIRFDAAVDARRLAQERLYSERERHTAEVKRLQLEIGRLTATPEPMGEAPIWNSIQIASWIGSQLMHEPAMFERAAVCKFVRSLGRHPTLLKHSPKDHVPAPGVPEGWRDAFDLAAQMLTWGRDEGLTPEQVNEVDAHAKLMFAMLAAQAKGADK